MPRHPLALLALAAIAGNTPIAAADTAPTGHDCPVLATQPGDVGLSAVHDCSGLNVCKGLGGCKITDADLLALEQVLQQGSESTTSELPAPVAG